MRDWLESLLCVVYPARCRCCSEPLGFSHVPYLCDVCWAGVPWIEPPFCSHCGVPLPAHLPHGIRCADCRTRPSRLPSRALARYRGAIREAIHLFKYESKFVFERHFGEMIRSMDERLHELGDIDGVVPVPLHRKRYRQRGFNQAENLARHVADTLGCPLLDDVLVRTRNTAPQSSLTDPAARRRNIRGAFQVAIPERLGADHLLLVDDIYTSGATVREAASVLRREGAEMVSVFTLTRV